MLLNARTARGRERHRRQQARRNELLARRMSRYVSGALALLTDNLHSKPAAKRAALIAARQKGFEKALLAAFRRGGGAAIVAGGQAALAAVSAHTAVKKNEDGGNTPPVGALAAVGATGAVVAARAVGARTNGFEALLKDYLTMRGARRVKNISDGIRRDLVQTLLVAEASGSGERAAAVLMKRRIKRFSLARAARIARTEVHSAANQAQDVVMGDNGYTVRVWSSAKQARTRATHLRADGQRVTGKQKFRVGGSRLRFPGDPNGAAKEIINCRCAALYEPAPARKLSKG